MSKKYFRAAAFYNNDQQCGVGVHFEDETVATAVMKAARESAVNYKKHGITAKELIEQLEAMAEWRERTGNITGAIANADERVHCVTAFINIYCLEAWGVLKAGEYNGVIAYRRG